MKIPNNLNYVNSFQITKYPHYLLNFQNMNKSIDVNRKDRDKMRSFRELTQR